MHIWMYAYRVEKGRDACEDQDVTKYVGRGKKRRAEEGRGRGREKRRGCPIRT